MAVCTKKEWHMYQNWYICPCFEVFSNCNQVRCPNVTDIGAPSAPGGRSTRSIRAARSGHYFMYLDKI